MNHQAAVIQILEFVGCSLVESRWATRQNPEIVSTSVPKMHPTNPTKFMQLVLSKKHFMLVKHGYPFLVKNCIHDIIFISYSGV